MINQGHKSISEVRAIHQRISQEMDETFPENSGLHLTQNDFAMVQAGFIGPVLLYPRKLGIYTSKDSLEAYVHFWRLIGFYLGIDDTVNCCKSYEFAEGYCRQIEKEVILMNLKNLNPNFSKLRSDFAEGLHQVGLFLTENSVLAYVCPEIGLEGPKFNGWNDWKAYIYIWVHSWAMFYFPFYRNYCNRRLMRMIKY